ncbi:MAG: bifunctional transaldolase/phosoglucose isomerase [Pseudomonadota bacterium]|jgi:transaldolase/glucose-6-phosphate isomerase
MNNIQKISGLGQSTWLDYIRRSFITSGELDKLIDSGVTGMTSNPSIFEKAITGSADYDGLLKTLTDEGFTTLQIYDELTREDISMAADLLRPVYEKSKGRDGYVSLEVNPHLAHDTQGTVSEGIRLFTTLNRPNVMIKVPATREGIMAVEELTRKGVNVNVTLIFSLGQYRDAAQAYILGLKKRAAENRPVDTIASVASFFVSRLDTDIDRVLDDMGLHELTGRAAVANAKLAYDRFTRIFSGQDWNRMVAAGAHIQRPLWASTSTKNPSYPDTKYVDSLIGPDTVNTMPMETFNAFMDHGSPSLSLSESVEDASRHIRQLQDAGVDLERITGDLLVKGVELFASSYDSLLEGISRKAAKLRAEKTDIYFSAPGFGDQIDRAIAALDNSRVIDRLSAHDHTLWKNDPEEITNRLGWLNSPGAMKKAVGRILETVERAKEEGFTDALLLGMGGSSLAPDLFRRTFKARAGYPRLRVLDSTDPAAVRDHTLKSEPARTLYIVSTKSGTTAETLSLFRYFYNQTVSAVGPEQAGKHFIAITDPGSPLQDLARESGFRETFLNDPDIGGRYSALSYFGLVPAALHGVDIDIILDRALNMAASCLDTGTSIREGNPGAVLGGILGDFHNSGLDKLTFITSPPIAALGPWLEQLLAESTGKEGMGILPVDGELPGKPEVYGKDRLFVYLKYTGDSTCDTVVNALIKDGKPVIRLELLDLYDLGSEFFRWEVATAVAGHIMGINPFNQPDVESAKVQARHMLDEYRTSGRLPPLTPDLTENGIEIVSLDPSPNLEGAVKKFLSGCGPGTYVALQAYLNPVPETALALGELRHAIRDRYNVATTVGFGPRFLHSTGQLHKGDGGNGLFIQITADSPLDVPIPDKTGDDSSSVTFGVLEAAQARGDRQALLDKGRRVIRFNLKKDVVEGIRLIKERMG